MSDEAVGSGNESERALEPTVAPRRPHTGEDEAGDESAGSGADADAPRPEIRPEASDRGAQQPAEPRLGSFWTIASLIVLVPVLAFVFWPPMSTARLATVDDPERALALVVGRTMDLRDAVRRTGPGERRLYGAIGLDAPGDVEQAIAWYEELLQEEVSPSVAVYLAVLEAEAGRFGVLRQRVDVWTARQPPLPALAALLRTAYLEPSPPGDPALFVTLEQWVEAGWFRDRLQVALGSRIGDRRAIEDGRTRAAERGRRLLGRARVLVAVLLGVTATGVIALGAVVIIARRRPQRLVIGTASMPPPWRGRHGAAVILRGAALTAVLSMLLVFVSPLGVLDPNWDRFVAHVVETLLGLMIAVPVVLLARRHLLRPRGVGLADGLGLHVVHGGGGRLTIVAPAVVALMLAGDFAIGLVADRVGAPGHWAEWFDESFAFGGPDAIVATLLSAVVLAPLTEEIVFRGVLFATFRRRFGWPVSAGLSALAFAALHGYGVAGFASVWWSGFVWAWTYERTRSLWPTIAVHAAGNLWASSLVLTLLR
jgi:membrane protease YdiL (CAAX protease family)